MAIRVGPESMMKYREDNRIPNSDAFEPEPVNRWDTIQIILEVKGQDRKCQKQVLKGIHHLLRYNACKYVLCFNVLPLVVRVFKFRALSYTKYG